MTAVAVALLRADKFDIQEVLERYRKDFDIDEARAETVWRELKRYLVLAATATRPYPMKGRPEDVDGLWHTFLIHTRLYAEFCEQVAGRFLHHRPVPLSAATDEDEIDASDVAYEDFLCRYEDEFGEIAPGEFWPRPIDIDELLGNQLAPIERSSQAALAETEDRVPDGAPNESVDLGRAIGELVGDAPAFLEQNWERGPFHRAGSTLANLTSVAEIDALLMSGSLPTPQHVRLIQPPTVRTPGFGPADYSRPTPARIQAEAASTVDPGKVLNLFDQGCTVVLQWLRRLMPRVDAFAAELERGLGHPIRVNGYITPPHAQGFDPHFDPHDVFVVQVKGTKDWTIWPEYARLPTQDHIPDLPTSLGEPHSRMQMREGDVLYIPRGWPHAARSCDTTSIHLTFAVRRQTWGQCMALAIDHLLAGEEYRAALPVGFDSDLEAWNGQLSEHLAVLAAAIRDLDPVEVASSFISSIDRETGSQAGRFADVVLATEVGETTQVAMTDFGRDILSIPPKGAPTIRLGGTEVSLPFQARATLRSLQMGAIVQAGEVIVGKDSVAESIELASELTRHGVVTIVDLCSD